MEHFKPAVVIDKTECVECKQCETDCLLTRWLGYGSIEEGPADACNLCGHCIASCEQNAIKHFQLDEEALRPIGEFPPTEQMLNLIIGRRSVRTYKDMPVKEEDWEKLIEAVQYSMTGCNIQDINLIIIESRDKLKRIADAIMGFTIVMEEQAADPDNRPLLEPAIGNLLIDSFSSYHNRNEQQKNLCAKGIDFALYDAAGLMLFTGPKADFTQVDAVLATQAVALLAPTLGIGTCNNGLIPAAYAGSFPPFLEAVEDILPEDQGIYSALMVGYETFKYSFVPPRKERKVIFR